MTIFTSNGVPLSVPLYPLADWGVGTFGSNIFGNSSQPYAISNLVVADRVAGKETVSDAVRSAGLLSGHGSKEVYESDLLDRVTSVAGLGTGITLENLRHFSRANRSWPGPPSMIDVSGRSRHGFSEEGVTWVGGGRATLGPVGALTTPHDGSYDLEEPRIEAYGKIPFEGTTTLFDHGSYSLVLADGVLIYTFEHSGGTEEITSEPLLQHGIRSRQTAVFAVEHLVDSGNTRIRFLASADGGDYRIIGPDVFQGAEQPVVAMTSPITISSDAVNAEVFWVRVLDAASGVLVATADLQGVPAGAVSWGSLTGETWTVALGSLPSEPEADIDDDVSDWGINLRGDEIRSVSALELEVAVGATVAVAIIADSHPAADVTLVANVEQPTQFSIKHRADEVFEVLLGGATYEAPATLGETTITGAFDSTGEQVQANGVDFQQVAGSAMPTSIVLYPSSTGRGSVDDDTYLFVGMAVLDRRLAADGLAELATLLHG
jgi:hypothetical protein